MSPYNVSKFRQVHAYMSGGKHVNFPQSYVWTKPNSFILFYFWKQINKT